MSACFYNQLRDSLTLSIDNSQLETFMVPQEQSIDRILQKCIKIVCRNCTSAINTRGNCKLKRFLTVLLINRLHRKRVSATLQLKLYYFQS